jgi:hypothetical protein
MSCRYKSDRKYNLKIHIKNAHNRDATDNELSREQISSIEEQISSAEEQISSTEEQISSENGTNIIQNGTNIIQVTQNSLACQKCLKNFKSFKGLKQHQTKCKGVSNSLECQYCHRVFATAQSKFKHLKICKIREVQELVEKHCIINNNNNTNTQTNNNNIQNIYNIYNYPSSHRNSSYNNAEIEMDVENINDFGKEDVSYIDPEKMRKIALTFDFKAYICEKHFNLEHPENHNIRENCNKSYKILRDKKWTVETKEFVHSAIYRNTSVEIYNYSSNKLIYKILDNKQTDQYLVDWENCVNKDHRRMHSYIDIQIKELMNKKKVNRMAHYQIKNSNVSAIEDTFHKMLEL